MAVKPELHLQEIQFIEQAADQCLKYNYFFIDGDIDGRIKWSDEKYYFPANECEENRLQTIWKS